MHGPQEQKTGNRSLRIMRLPDMTVIGIAIGTSIVPTLIIVTCLFLSTVSGGAFTHGITIPTTAMVTAITHITTPTVIQTTTASIPTTLMAIPLPTRIATIMAML